MRRTDKQWQWGKQRKHVTVQAERNVFEPKPPVHIARAKVYVPEAPGLPESKCNHLRDVVQYLIGVGIIYSLLTWILSLTIDYDFSIRRVLAFLVGMAIVKGTLTYLDEHRDECR